MPAIFFGHGNPMNALYQNSYTHAWRELGRTIPKPKAILCISAHWYMPGTSVTFDQQPQTIHDFGGFPKELYQVQYPAPGNQELASEVQKILAPLKVDLDYDWGLDHGTWSVLCHVYPEANIPIVQLSIDETKPAEFHFEIGTRISSLREQGILIMGSGNIVHNLHTYAWGRHVPEPYDWAVRFENKARELMMAGNFKPLIDYENFGKDAILSIPTSDHYLPLLYVLGTWKEGEKISFPVVGVDGGSISMLAVQLGS
jgi:4,5-DOPA dioxygenase extradiol